MADIFSGELWNRYKDKLGHIESSNTYGKIGGSNDHYDGKYQFGKIAKKDIGLGHTKKEREDFRKDPVAQENALLEFTKLNYSRLMKNKDFAGMDINQQMGTLAYAHNQGATGAKNWLKTGVSGKDGFGTYGTKYYKAFTDKNPAINFNSKPKERPADLGVNISPKMRPESIIEVPSLDNSYVVPPMSSIRPQMRTNQQSTDPIAVEQAIMAASVPQQQVFLSPPPILNYMDNKKTRGYNQGTSKVVPRLYANGTEGVIPDWLNDMGGYPQEYLDNYLATMDPEQAVLNGVAPQSVNPSYDSMRMQQESNAAEAERIRKEIAETNAKREALRVAYNNRDIIPVPAMPQTVSGEPEVLEIAPKVINAPSAEMAARNKQEYDQMTSVPAIPGYNMSVPLVEDPRNLGGSEGYGQNVSSTKVLDYNPRNTGEAAFQLQTEQNLNDKLYTDRLKLQREIDRLEEAAITPYDFKRLQKMKDQLVAMGGSTIENPKTDQLLQAESNYNESIINDRNDATMSEVSRNRRIANDTVSELEKTLATADPDLKPSIEIRLNKAQAALENAENAFNSAQANLETVPSDTVTNVPPLNKELVVDDPAMDNREKVLNDIDSVPAIDNAKEIVPGSTSGTGLSLRKDGQIVGPNGNIIGLPGEVEAKSFGTTMSELGNKLGPIFKALFGLETQDVTRALGFYLMSRLSGASHEGSMRWAGTTVLKQAEARDIRNDAKTDAAIKAFAEVKNTYTAAAASKINKLLSEGKLLEAQTVMSDPKSKTFRGRYGIDADDAGTPMMRAGSTRPVLIFTGTDGQVFKKITVDGKEGFKKVSTEEYTNLRERVVGDNRASLRNDLESAMNKMNSTLFRQEGIDKDTKKRYEAGIFGGQDQGGVIAAIMQKSDELGALGLDNIPTDILDRFIKVAELAESQGIKKIDAITLLDTIYVGGQGLVNTEKLTTDDGEMLTSSQIGSFTDAFKEMFPGIKGQPNYSAIQSTFAAAEANADTELFSTVKGVTEVAKALTDPKLTPAQIKKISSMPNVYTASVLFEAFKLQSKK